jgi:hypothetical protein
MSLTLLSLASPAAAQFSASDLNGTWFMRGLVVGAAIDNGAAFANGTGPVTVHYQTISGTAIAGVDFLPLAGTLTFGPGVGSQLIPLVILNDVIAEGAETFTIQLSNPQPLGGLKLGPHAVKVFTIVDNDFGGSNIRFDAPVYSGDEGQKVTLTVRRDGGLGTTLTVNWRAVGGNALAGTDFTPAEGSVMFASTASAATFQITLASDAVVEGPEFALLALEVPAGAALLGTQSTTTLTIAGRTAPPIQFESATYSVLETAGAATIALVREGNLAWCG